MTQRGPGCNKRQTQSSTEPDKTPRGSSPRSCPTRNPNPSRSNGRRRRVPAAVHAQYTQHRCSGRFATPRWLSPRPASRQVLMHAGLPAWTRCISSCRSPTARRTLWRSLSDCGQATSCDALARHVPWCRHARKTCIAGTVMIYYAVCICIPLGLYYNMPGGYGRGRQCLLEMGTVGHKTAVDRPPTAAD